MSAIDMKQPWTSTPARQLIDLILDMPTKRINGTPGDPERIAKAEAKRERQKANREADRLATLRRLGRV